MIDQSDKPIKKRIVKKQVYVGTNKIKLRGNQK